jgi:phage baseplate assembly protein W
MSNNLKPNNSLEKFHRTIPGKKNLPEDIDCRLVDSGDLLHLTGINAIVAGITRILLTSKDTYLFDPKFGLGLHKYIFEPKDTITRDQIQADVQDTLRKYEGRCQITVSVKFLKNIKGFAIDLVVKYEGEDKKLSINIDEKLLKTLQERP